MIQPQNRLTKTNHRFKRVRQGICTILSDILADKGRFSSHSRQFLALENVTSSRQKIVFAPSLALSVVTGSFFDTVGAMNAKNQRVLVALAFVAFISLGMPDGLHGVAWPSVRDSFKLPVDAIGILLIFSTTGYISASFFNGVLIRWLGLGGLLAVSCVVTGTALLVYGSAPVWPIFVAVSFMGGLGGGAIDAGLNTYVAQNHSETIMQWLHGFFGVGITLGPIIMTLGLQFLQSWRPGYLVVGTTQLLLAGLFFVTRRRWPGKNIAEEARSWGNLPIDDGASSHGADDLGGQDAGTKGAGGKNVVSMRETLRQFPSILSMMLFFVYTGVELGLGIWSYSLLTESRGIDPTLAGLITGSYWAMFTVGRMLAGLYMKKLRIMTVLMGSTVLAIIGMLLVLLRIDAWVSVFGIAMTGFAIAPIFPGLVSDTVNRVGKRHETNTIGMQVAAAGFGVAIIPSIAGLFARRFSLEAIPLFILAAIFLLLLGLLLSHRHSTPPASPSPSA